MDDGHGMRRIGFGQLLVTENSERQDHSAQRAVIAGNLGEHPVMGGDVVGIELDCLDRTSTGISQPRHLRRELVAAPCSQYDSAAGSESDRDFHPDLAPTTEQQNCVVVIGTSHTHSLADYRVDMATTPVAPASLTSEALQFLADRHLATLTTLRPDGTPHVVAVGFTWDPDSSIVRVITSGKSQKALNAARGGYAAVSQVDGARWLTLEGPSSVLTEGADVADAEHRYAGRYRVPRENPERVVIAIEVRRILGSRSLIAR